MRISIKISVILWAVVLLAGTGYILARLVAFVGLFFQHAGIQLRQADALEAYNQDGHGLLGGGGKRVQHIPKIVHQVFHNWKEPGNDSLPGDWEGVRGGCVERNPGWEFKLWTERTSREFIEREYPWFLRTYDGYRYKVQRVDAVRYFLLYHHGGIYMDLDNGCKTDLTPLLYYPFWITDGGRGALSNNILASKPRHPFWNLVTMSLMEYDWNYLFPYITISFASGQWFETAVWEKYHSLLPKPGADPEMEHRGYRLIMDDRPEADEWIFFTQERGGTWVNWDNKMFLAIGKHLFLLFASLVGLAAVVFWGGSRCLRRYNRAGYTRLKNRNVVGSSV
ncbi:hypothetical protein QC762_206540 [Podospora pseudocomata]|uniref:Glycosyltransferase Family 32 n=1 Tax=Podospora pseudocomata TaxID=2093779 RepID=A0ABR0GLS7_9PEZI|nr:hypothetical protein QC762_206540 [Podospora pseudocomata]